MTLTMSTRARSSSSHALGNRPANRSPLLLWWWYDIRRFSRFSCPVTTFYDTFPGALLYISFSPLSVYPNGSENMWKQSLFVTPRAKTADGLIPPAEKLSKWYERILVKTEIKNWFYCKKNSGKSPIYRSFAVVNFILDFSKMQIWINYEQKR